MTGRKTRDVFALKCSCSWISYNSLGYYEINMHVNQMVNILKGTVRKSTLFFSREVHNTVHLYELYFLLLAPALVHELIVNYSDAISEKHGCPKFQVTWIFS